MKGQIYRSVILIMLYKFQKISTEWQQTETIGYAMIDDQVHWLGDALLFLTWLAARGLGLVHHRAQVISEAL